MLSSYIFVLLTICLWFVPASVVDPGTIIKVGNNVIDTKPLVRKLKKFVSESGGRQLRFKANKGCVDAGHHTSDPKAGDILTPYINERCGSHPWTKWFWDGDYLKVGWTSDYPGTYGCLGFWDETDFPDVDVFSCVDISPFIIRFHPSQLDFSNLEIFFSIHSKVHPTKCLGMYNKNVEIHPSYRGSHNKTVRKDVFQLQDCSGLDHQSFYVDHKQFDVIDKVKQKMFGPEGMSPWSREKNSNCTSASINRINTK